MKRIRTYISKYIVVLLAATTIIGCSDILDENPRGTYTPEYFKTEAGVLGGVTSLYAHLRYIYGNGYWLNACETGTDEYTYGHGADGNYKDMDLSGIGSLTPSSSRSDVLWNAAYSNINTANGILEYGAQAGVAPSILAEAHFFRAFDYFMLVQTFGGVPLDLGSGELRFNTSTSRNSVRNTVPEVYTKCVFPDLLAAINDLPDAANKKGGATKTLARLYLAKAYLTYGWWLENPKNIPTYPNTARIDPDGHDYQWYFQQAYNISTQAIDNPGPFGLQSTFYDVHVAKNDRHNEMLLYADHIESSEYYDGSSHSYNTGTSPGNFAVWMATWDYTFLESAPNPDWRIEDNINNKKTTVSPIRSVRREAAQAYGRPWKCMAPPIEIITNTFADKTNDSRCDATFVLSFRANWNQDGEKRVVLYNANGMEVRPGDAILTFLNEDPSAPITYLSPAIMRNKANTADSLIYKNISNVGAGVLPGRADYVIAPSAISRYAYPNLWKLGTYRTDYDKNTSLGEPNGGLTRPFPIAKFSELYLVAAEAAVKGAATTAGKSARDLINVLRARAGVWRWDNNGNQAKNEDNSAAMTAATPANITIGYILEERSREYFGEGHRWHDLVRTQTWAELAASYTICGLDSKTGVGDHTMKTYTRDIKDYQYLRPIPTGQLNGMEMTAEAKSTYQNPGYN